jgi:hypothetical protein
MSQTTSAKDEPDSPGIVWRKDTAPRYIGNPAYAISRTPPQKPKPPLSLVVDH